VTFGGRQFITGGTVVKPGESYAFKFDVVVSGPVGTTHTCQWMMVDDLQPNSRWFGERTPNAAVNVVAAVETPQPPVPVPPIEPITYKIKFPATLKLTIPTSGGGTEDVIASVEIEHE
jgi:hypothetical protein